MYTTAIALTTVIGLLGIVCVKTETCGSTDGLTEPLVENDVTGITMLKFDNTRILHFNKANNEINIIDTSTINDDGIFPESENIKDFEPIVRDGNTFLYESKQGFTELGPYMHIFFCLTIEKSEDDYYALLFSGTQQSNIISKVFYSVAPRDDPHPEFCAICGKEDKDRADTITVAENLEDLPTESVQVSCRIPSCCDKPDCPVVQDDPIRNVCRKLVELLPPQEPCDPGQSQTEQQSMSARRRLKNRKTIERRHGKGKGKRAKGKGGKSSSSESSEESEEIEPTCPRLEALKCILGDLVMKCAELIAN